MPPEPTGSPDFDISLEEEDEEMDEEEEGKEADFKIGPDCDLF